MQPHGYSPVIPDFPGTPGLGAETVHAAAGIAGRDLLALPENITFCGDAKGDFTVSVYQ
jgi:hypothetical protein